MLRTVIFSKILICDWFADQFQLVVFSIVQAGRLGKDSAVSLVSLVSLFGLVLSWRVGSNAAEWTGSIVDRSSS